MNLLFPRRAVCMACGRMTGHTRDDVCEDCRAALAQNFIGALGPMPALGVDFACAAHPYPGPAGGLVRSLKYGGVAILARRMGADLARAAALMRMPEGTRVAFVPMHPKRLRRRGRNHAELLARALAAEMGLECVELLARTRNAPQQARLETAERRRNLRGGFVVRPEWARRVCGERILLVDDVLTTGATAESCAKALKAAGAKRVYLAVYAHGGQKKKK